MNTKPLCVVDFETGGVIKTTAGTLDVAAVLPIQVACLVLDPRSLKVVPGSEFMTMMRPPKGSALQEEALKVNRKTPAEIWAAPADYETAWGRFAAHVKKFGDPIFVAKNGRRFDFPIVQWFCGRFGPASKTGQQSLFHQKIDLDLDDFVFHWFEDSDDIPSRGNNGVSKMDDIRPYFGLSNEHSHDAMTDVIQTAVLIRKFLKLYRELKPKVRFRGSASADELA